MTQTSFPAREKREDPHEALFWRFGSQMAIRQGDWKLVRASRGLKEYEDIATEPMLFNLAADIGEQRDLASQSPQKVRDLQALWDRWNRQLASHGRRQTCPALRYGLLDAVLPLLKMPC